MNTNKTLGLILVAFVVSSSTIADKPAIEINMQRYGTLCITNELNCTINYTYKWGKNARWQSAFIHSGWNKTHYYAYSGSKRVSPTFYIRFDYDLSNSDRYEEYRLKRYASWTDECDDAYSYVFRVKSTHSDYFDLYDCE